ncbi:MAG: hypothetical protein COB54_04460 [Alphaproteobacteria bacterium]|nr:MAG: hypothetical protein COB54_04460 [Alphaproteobacteria bacterium]
MYRVIILSAIMAVFGLSQMALSADLPKASKRENVEYYEVVYVKYKVGKAEDAFRMIKKYFIPASEAAGTLEPYVINFQTGPWDVALFWTRNSMGDFDWSISPDNEKWFAAFVKQTGSMEKAQAILDKYYDLIAENRVDMAYHKMTPKD